MPCATPEPEPANSSRFWASEAWAISACNTRAKMGFKTVAIARGADKEALAKKLGAHVYLDNSTQDIAKELQKMGGARIILATLTSADAMTQAADGLGIDGQLLILGAAEKPIQFNSTQAISFRSGVRAWYSGNVDGIRRKRWRSAR